MNSEQVVDWNTQTQVCLVNPRLADPYRTAVQKALFALGEADLVWVASSGSSASPSADLSPFGPAPFKWVALSRAAILCSAEAVNCHLQSHSRDVWVHALPDFHVGGLGIWARAHLSGAAVHTLGDRPASWDPREFVKLATEVKGTLSALVPAQIFDLVREELAAPPSLRAIVVGGAALAPDLLAAARRLGWPLLPSYGLSECASQVATASLLSLDADYKNNDTLPVLRHVNVKIDIEGRLFLRSEALLSRYAFLEEVPRVDFPVRQGWFATDDCAVVENGRLRLLGRRDDMVKVGGEAVSLAALETILERECTLVASELRKGCAVVAVPDSRLGHVLVLCFQESLPRCFVEKAFDNFNAFVQPFQRFRHMVALPILPRTALGKLARGSINMLVREKLAVDTEEGEPPIPFQ